MLAQADSIFEGKETFTSAASSCMKLWSLGTGMARRRERRKTASQHGTPNTSSGVITALFLVFLETQLCCTAQSLTSHSAVTFVT